MAIVAGLPALSSEEPDPLTALAGCAQIPEGPWRGECAFYVADALGLRGEAAIAACDQAGKLRSPCIGHAIQREAQAALRDMPVGAELNALSAVERVTSRYLGSGPDSRSRAQQLLNQAVSQREPGAPFSLTLCGALDAPSCEAAFRQRTQVAALKLRPNDSEPWRIACARSVSVERATSLGLPAWTPDFEPTAASVWTDLCRR